MRVLLMVPTFHYREHPPVLLSASDFPSGFAYLAASLKQGGHEVYGLNPNNPISPDSKNYYTLANKLLKVIEEVKPELIGLGGICIDFQFIKDAIELCRQFAPNTPVVLGGGILTNDREFIFNFLKPDFGIVGEGEDAIIKLADMLQIDKDINGHKPFSQIENLSYWDDGKPIFNPINHHYGPADNRPFPDYEPFGIQEMLDSYSMATRLLYRYSRPDPRPFIIVTARGCPFNCSFCIHRGNQFYRPRSIENIMAEIRMNYERYRFNILIILDELFAVNKVRMQEFCRAVLDGKREYGWDFDWMFQTHASAALDKEILELAKEAGCSFFSYGLESASPTVLKSMNKKTKPSQIIEAIQLAEAVGIGFGGNLIFGDPAETQTTIYESLSFFAKYCQKSFVFLGLLMPYPGNKLFDYCLEKGIIKDKLTYYANIDNGVFNMTAMPDQMWYQWINFFPILERSWLWVKDVNAISIKLEPDYIDPVMTCNDARMYRIEAECLYCGQRSTYRELIRKTPVDWPLFLGIGCQHCNSRIKVNLSTFGSIEGLSPIDLKVEALR